MGIYPSVTAAPVVEHRDVTAAPLSQSEHVRPGCRGSPVVVGSRHASDSRRRTTRVKLRELVNREIVDGYGATTRPCVMIIKRVWNRHRTPQPARDFPTT